MGEKVKRIVADSAFVEPEVEEPTFKEWLQAKLDSIFINNIPLDSVKELPTLYMYAFGLLAYMMSVSCFVYFIYTGYQEERTKAFIALDPSDGVCDKVPKSVNGQFYGDFSGKWEGTDGFQYSNSLYVLNLNNFRHSVSDYRHMMDAVGDSLDVLGTAAFDFDLAENLAYWMAWEVQLPGADTVNTFRMTGQPEVIFHREYVFGVFASVGGECLTSRTTEYDKANAVLKVTYDEPSLAADDVCAATVKPENMGWIREYDFNEFKLEIDVRSLVIAFAVNNHILDYNSLEEVTGTGRTIDFNGTTIKTTEMFFNRYPGHKTIECSTVDNKVVCGMLFGDTFALPIFNHYGASFDYPLSCNCSLGFGTELYCNVFDFMVGVIFYNINDTYTSPDNKIHPNAWATMNLAYRYSDPKELNRRAFNASYAATMYGEYTDPKWRETAYEFCHSEEFNTSCSILLFNAYDDVSFTASEFYYQVKLGACNDSFTVGTWNLLQRTPPTDLVQDYYECIVSWYVAIFNSTGIAAGNAATFVPFLMLALLPLLYVYLQASGKLPPKDEYTELELTAASNALALTILRIRDGKVRGIEQQGLLKKLVKELIHAAKSEGGYPDSDDDSDDESEGTTSKEVNDAKVVPKGRYRSSIFIRKKEEPEVKAEVQSPLRGIFGGVDDPEQLQSTNGTNRRYGAAERKSAIRSGELVVLNDFEPISRRRSFGRASIKSTIHTEEEALDLVNVLKMHMQKALDVKDLDGGGAVFRTAQNKSADLKLINMRALVSSSDEMGKYLFMQTLNLIAMHACLALSCTMPDVSRLHSDRVAYDIGGRVYLASEIQQIADGGANPLIIGVEATSLKNKLFSF